MTPCYSDYASNMDKDALPARTYGKHDIMTEELLCGKRTPVPLSYVEQENITTFKPNEVRMYAIVCERVQIQEHEEHIHSRFPLDWQNVTKW